MNQDAPKSDKKSLFQSSESRGLLSLFLFMFAGFFAIGMVFLTESSDLEYIKSRLDQRVLFNLRQKIIGSVPIDERIKIFVIDDATLSWNNNNPDFELEEWVILLENLAQNNPKVILIDKIFGANADVMANDSGSVQMLLERLKAIEVPIYIGAFPMQQKIHHRYMVHLKESSHDLPQFLPPSFKDASTLKELNEDMPKRYIYGPSQSFEDVFKGLGHISYEQKGVPSIFPFFIAMQEPRLVVPHLSLRVADKLYFDGKNLFVNDQEVPLDSKGRIYLNHRKWQTVEGEKAVFNPKRLIGPIERAKKKETERFVNDGDIVFIIPGFYTGGTDIHEGGPFGEIPGGLIIASMIDSVLTGNWIHYIDQDIIFILLFACAGALLGSFAGPLMFWIIFAGIIIGFCITAISLFCFYNTVIPWSLPLLTFIGTSLTLYAENISRRELKRIRLEREFFKEKALRVQEESQKKILEERLSLGKAVQDMLLPSKLVGQIGPFNYQMRYHPSQQMSGDWLFFWDVSPHEKRILIGDVVGKGPSAALPVAMIIASLKEAKEKKLSFADSIQLINDRMVEQFQCNVTSTLAGVALFEDHSLQFANAGSPGWFIMEGNRPRYLNLRSSPLGLNLGNQGVHITIRLSGDIMFFTYTDGYMEGSRAAHRLLKVLKTYDFEDIDHNVLHESMLIAGEGLRLEDDMTMVSIRAHLSSPKIPS